MPALKVVSFLHWSVNQNYQSPHFVSATDWLFLFRKSRQGGLHFGLWIWFVHSSWHLQSSIQSLVQLHCGKRQIWPGKNGPYWFGEVFVHKIEPKITDDLALSTDFNQTVLPVLLISCNVSALFPPESDIQHSELQQNQVIVSWRHVTFGEVLKSAQVVSVLIAWKAIGSHNFCSGKLLQKLHTCSRQRDTKQPKRGLESIRVCVFSQCHRRKFLDGKEFCMNPVFIKMHSLSFVLFVGYEYLQSMFTTTVARTTEEITWCRLPFALTERMTFISSPTAIPIRTPDSKTTSMHWRRKITIMSKEICCASAW